jgi:uncharacterized protein (TIGR02186 family)
MKHSLILLLVLLVVSIASFVAADTEGTTRASIRVSPEPLEVTTFFSGAALTVTGHAPARMKLAVLVSGADTDITVKKKGKVWGVLWMNVGEAEIRSIPSVYLLSTSAQLAQLGSPAVRQAKGIGLDVLGASRGITGDGADVLSELVKLKKHEHLYGSFESSVTTRPSQAEEVEYTTQLPVPACIPEGSYNVELWGFGTAEEKVQLLAAAELTVKTVGVTHSIAEFAHAHGLLYGIFALITALAVGLLTGLLFGLAGKGGH